MKYKLVLLALLFLEFSCINNHEEDKTSTENECNHSVDYGFCDNLDTALLYAEKIEQLTIWQKKYKILPTEILRMKKLKRVSLFEQTDLNWADAFIKFSTFDSLTDLEIANCHVLSFCNIGKLKNLKWLTIYDSSIIDFPIEITQCKSLTNLSILPSISSVPEEVKNLRNLKSLVIIIDNKKFPMELLFLENLEELYLGGDIESIPNEIINLKQLKNLWLDGTSIGERELKYYQLHKEYNELKYIYTKMPNCTIHLESKLPG